MSNTLDALILAGTVTIEIRDGVTCLVVALDDSAPAVPSQALLRKGHVMRAVINAARQYSDAGTIIRAAAASLAVPQRGVRDRRLERARRAYVTLSERGELPNCR